MQFLSDDWLAAMDEAARGRVAPDDDALAGVSLSVEQVITDGPRWRLVVDHGVCSVVSGAALDDAEDADIRLTSDRSTAEAIAAGERSALESFIAGDLVLGGDVRVLLQHRAALELLGDLFAQVKTSTTFA